MTQDDEKMAGTIVSDRYELTELIGSGGMAVIYRTIVRPMNKTFALKLLRSHMSTTPKYMLHLMQEAKALSSLSHPSVAKVHDFGATDEGRPYLLMEPVAGESLQQVIDREKGVDLERALNIFSQASDALAYAAGNSIYHGDLKPSHILIYKDAQGKESVKLIGFRVVGAEQVGSGGKPIDSKTGEIYGCPPYMSPEQCRCKPLDQRSDIYSLACVIYEAVTGRSPFLKETAQATLLQQISADPEPLGLAAEPAKGQRLQEVLFKAMAKEADARYQTMDEFKAALESI